MKKSSFALLAVAATTASLVAVAAPAHAYDVNAYEYAAGHMILNTDIPKALGDFGTDMDFAANEDASPVYLCYVGDKEVKIAGGKANYNAFFNPTAKTDSSNLSESVTQYPSAQKAIAAFDKLQSRVKSCTGTTTNTWTDDNGGAPATSSTVTTNGKVPMVTEVGVKSVFVNTNVLTASDNVDERYASDTYTVYTLLDDVILSTSFTSGSTDNITTKDRRKVNRVAFTAIDRWLN